MPRDPGVRLLVLTHRLPFPPHKGEKIRALNIVKHLARDHTVYLGCLVDDSGDLQHLERLRPWVHGVVHRRLRPRLRRALAASAIVGRAPITVRYFHTRALQSALDRLIEREAIEGILCSSSAMAEYLFRSKHADRLGSIPKVMDLTDIDSRKWSDYADRFPPWTRWLYRREARTLAAYERRIARVFDQLLVVSDAERRAFPENPLPDNLVTMGNGVDLRYFSPRRSRRDTSPVPTLVFTGVMDYAPNVDGVRWFVERVLPAIRREVPEVRLCIVGNRPTAEVRRLGAQRDVVVTGFVEDVRDYLAAADVCIAPLRIARGVQNKVLEAMAMGRSIVATRAAFEGLEAVPGRDLLVADDEATFASSTIGLLRDPVAREVLGRRARRYVEMRHSWEHNLAALDRLFAPSRAIASVPGSHFGAPA